jgi:hypothetical protein
MLSVIVLNVVMLMVVAPVKMKEFNLGNADRSGRLATVNNMGQYWQHFIFFATYGYE